jgi:hypothetical protein
MQLQLDCYRDARNKVSQSADYVVRAAKTDLTWDDAAAAV